MISNQSAAVLYTDCARCNEPQTPPPPPGFKVVYNFEERIILIMKRGSKVGMWALYLCSHSFDVNSNIMLISVHHSHLSLSPI